MMDHVSLALKYRPMRFADLVGQEQVTGPLSQAVLLGRIAPAYLFSGPRGSGKTTTARILAKALNCQNRQGAEPCNACPACLGITTGSSLDVIEIDGASNRGIDDIRDIRERVRYAPAGSGKKVYIVDEVHMLTDQAFNAFLKTLEEPPPHVVFVFATTDPADLLETVRSRCQRYDFHRITVQQSFGRLRWIADQEKLQVDEPALYFIARRAEGSLRDALVLLDQAVNAADGPITEELVRRLVGHAGTEFFFRLTDAVLERSPERAVQLLSEALNQGAREPLLLAGLCEHFRNLMLARVSPALEGLVEGTPEMLARYREGAQRFPEEDLIQCLELCLEGATRLERSPHPRFYLELLVVTLARLDSVKSLERILDHLETGLPPSTQLSPRTTLGRGEGSGGGSKGGKGTRGEDGGSIPTGVHGAVIEPGYVGTIIAGRAMDRPAPAHGNPTPAPPTGPTATGHIDPELWHALLQQTTHTHKTLAAFLEVAEPIGYVDGAFCVSVASPFQRAQLASREHIQFLQSKLQELGAPSCRFQCVVGAPSSARAPSPAAPPPAAPPPAAPPSDPSAVARPRDPAASVRAHGDSSSSTSARPAKPDLVDQVLKVFGGEVVP